MAKGNGKVGEVALDKLTEIKKGILDKMTTAVDGEELEYLAKAYGRLCEAEFQELRNLDEAIDMEQRRQAGYNRYSGVLTTGGYYATAAATAPTPSNQV